MPDYTAYLQRLSDLGREFGIGLVWPIQSYELEQDDTRFDYSADADGVIRLGSAGDTNREAGAGTGRDT